MYWRMPRRSVSFTVLVSCSGFENVFQGFEATLVLLWCSHRNADPLSQLITAHRPNDDSQLLHFSEYSLSISDANQNKVGVRRNELKTEFAELTGVELQPAGVDAAGFFNVLSVF